jgi:hypothetical protein
MAMPVSSVSTYVGIGNREDLSDVIYRIDPTETPFTSGIERAKASAVKHEWQTQALAAATATNIQLEGDDATADAFTPTVRLNNYCMISRKVPYVTGTQEAVEHAGRGSEMAMQETLKGLELKRDVETYLLSNNATSTGTSTVGRQAATVLSWLKTNTSKNSATGDPSAADGTSLRTDAATTRAFTESQLKTVLQSIWTNGGKPDIVMANGFNKQQFSTFTGRASPTEDTRAKKITASVDAYQSDFGDLKVVANRFQRARDVLVLQTDLWAIAHLNGRKMVSFDLAKTGDTIKKQILTEYTLEARNEKGSGIIADLTSA